MKSNSTIEQTEDITYVALGPNCWGSSNTSAEEAIKFGKRNGRAWLRQSDFSVWGVYCKPELISISDIDGEIQYPRGTRVEKLQTSKKAVK